MIKLVITYLIFPLYFFSQADAPLKPDYSQSELKNKNRKALVSVTEKIKINPKELSYRFERIYLLFSLTKIDSAKDQIIELLKYNQKEKWELNGKKLKRKTTDSIISDSIVSYISQLGKIEDSNAVLVESLKSLRKRPDLYVYTALTTKYADESLELLKKAYKLDKNNFAALFQMAELYKSMDDRENAIKFYKLSKPLLSEENDHYLIKTINQYLEELSSPKENTR